MILNLCSWSTTYFLFNKVLREACSKREETLQYTSDILGTF